MLQQTQVSRVLEKYPAFLRTFPSLGALARAHQRTVVRAWQGLGYNNRAVRLHHLSRAVVRNTGGKVPVDIQALRTLPGVGPYTAHAIRVFAFGKQEPAIEVNGNRVLSRLFGRMRTTHSLLPKEIVSTIAGAVLARGNAYEWNQALMDLGATVCTLRSPRCAACPAGSICASRRTMRSASKRPGRREPSLAGIPNRIYRGRIVELLRQSARPVSLPRVASMIHEGFSVRHQQWFERLVGDLVRDGLVSIGGNGSFRSRTLTLR
jgi:A/G-specific adenine glycosylase